MIKCSVLIAGIFISGALSIIARDIFMWAISKAKKAKSLQGDGGQNTADHCPYYRADGSCEMLINKFEKPGFK